MSEIITAGVAYVAPVMVGFLCSYFASVKHTDRVVTHTVLILTQERLIELYQRLAPSEKLTVSEYNGWVALYRMLVTLSPPNQLASLKRMNSTIESKEVTVNG